jgi:hypothetical protein
MAAAIREDVVPHFDAIKGRLDLDDALAWIETARGGGIAIPRLGDPSALDSRDLT